MARTDAPPATDSRMWRRLLAAVHPDRGEAEDGGLFTWATALREYVEAGGRLCSGCTLNAGPGRSYATGADPDITEVANEARNYARSFTG